MGLPPDPVLTARRPALKGLLLALAPPDVTPERVDRALARPVFSEETVYAPVENMESGWRHRLRDPIGMLEVLVERGLAPEDTFDPKARRRWWCSYCQGTGRVPGRPCDCGPGTWAALNAFDLLSWLSIGLTAIRLAEDLARELEPEGEAVWRVMSPYDARTLMWPVDPPPGGGGTRIVGHLPPLVYLHGRAPRLVTLCVEWLPPSDR